MKPLGTGSPGKARSIDTVVSGGPGLGWWCLAAALCGAGLAGALAAPVPACAGTAGQHERQHRDQDEAAAPGGPSGGGLASAAHYRQAPPGARRVAASVVRMASHRG